MCVCGRGAVELCCTPPPPPLFSSIVFYGVSLLIHHAHLYLLFCVHLLPSLAAYPPRSLEQVSSPIYAAPLSYHHLYRHTHTHAP